MIFNQFSQLSSSLLFHHTPELETLKKMEQLYSFFIVNPLIKFGITPLLATAASAAMAGMVAFGISSLIYKNNQDRYSTANMVVVMFSGAFGGIVATTALLFTLGWKILILPFCLIVAGILYLRRK